MDKMTIEKAKAWTRVNWASENFSEDEFIHATWFIEGYESRDAEVDGLKSEIESLQLRLRKTTGTDYLRA